MWSARRSLALSKFCIGLFALSLLAVLVFSPSVITWILSISQGEAEKARMVCFYLTFFWGGALCYILLYNLYRLLQNMGRSRVFVAKNVAYMRRISWLCIAGGVLAFASALYWLPWLAVAGAAGFVGLVVRVFKNVLAEAIALKEENDFTI